MKYMLIPAMAMAELINWEEYRASLKSNGRERENQK